MKNIQVKDLSVNEDLDPSALAGISGGRIKLSDQSDRINRMLTTPDGDPVQVYVDGVLTNSVSDGYFPG